MQRTRNLNLNLPGQSDQYNIAHFNQNFNIIDNYIINVPRAYKAQSLSPGTTINGVTFDGLHKVITGLGTYSSEDKYAENNIAFKIENGNKLLIKKSKINENENNNFNDDNYWQIVDISQNIPIASTLNLGLVKVDGETINIDANGVLSNIAMDRHALKGYLDEGELLTDREGLTDVNFFASSEFDINKFTKVGSPIISNDGVMSNISASNYVKIDTSNITYSKSLEIIFPIRRTSLDSAQWFASSGTNVASSGGIWLGFSIGNKIRFFASSGNGTYDIASEPISTETLVFATKYYIKLQWTGTQYIISYSRDKITWTTAITVDSSTIAPLNNADLFLGYGSGAAFFQGDYFLNEVLIKADDKPVFSGNETGIDVVKPVNYTTVGSPTITDDGIATFAANKYITLPEIDVTGKTFEIDFGKITPNNVTTTQNIISGVNSNLLTIGVAGSNSRIFATSTNWSNAINTDPLTANNTYYLKAGYDGTNAYLSLSTDGINYTKTTVELTTQFTTLSLKIGTLYNGTAPILFPYDLNQFKFYVDNKLVYQPCLLIPYAESSTHSKIVDSFYRDRVLDVYNQKGKARYFTLSDTDFTLPMGEIYGMMNTVVDSYINGTSGYRVYEDGYCEQWGYIATNSSGVNSYTVTLLIPYKDTNYIFNRSPYWAVDNYPTVDSIYDNGYRVKTKSAITFYMHENSLQTGTEWNTSGYIY